MFNAFVLFHINEPALPALSCDGAEVVRVIEISFLERIKGQYGDIHVIFLASACKNAIVSNSQFAFPHAGTEEDIV
jgi:hypothetical protein